MNITSEVNHNVTPKALAEALAKSTPDEFASFWFEFAKLTEKRAEPLHSFAKAMSDDMGGRRKDPLKKLVKVMEYYETKRQEGLE